MVNIKTDRDFLKSMPVPIKKTETVGKKTWFGAAKSFINFVKEHTASQIMSKSIRVITTSKNTFADSSMMLYTMTRVPSREVCLDNSHRPAGGALA